VWQQAKRTAEEGYGIWQQRSFSRTQVYHRGRRGLSGARARALRKFAAGAATVENALPCLALLPRAAGISMQDVSHE